MGSYRRYSYSQWILSLVVCLGIVFLSPSAQSAPPSASGPSFSQLTAQLSEGRALYESGQLSAARQTLEATLQQARTDRNALGEAVTLSNLALVEGQQGNWEAANTAIDSSMTLLETLTERDVERQNNILAQTFNIKGRLQFAQGQSAQAFETWQHSEDLYRQANNSTGAIHARLRQARALQALGFHQRAVTEILYPLYQQVQANDEVSLARVSTLNTLAEAFGVVEGGTFAQALTAAQSTTQSTAQPLPTAQQIAEKSLDIALRLEAMGSTQETTDAIASTQLTLGNLAFADIQATLTQNTAFNLKDLFFSHTDPVPFYQQVIDSSASPASKVRAQLNQLNFLVTIAEAYQKRGQSSQAQSWFNQAIALWPTLHSSLSNPEQFPPTREGIYARINLAKSGLSLAQTALPNAPNWSDIEAILNQGLVTAKELSDQRSIAYVMGSLGTVSKEKGAVQEAIAQTEAALQISKSINATDISYRWYEQLGKLAETNQDKRTAIKVYTGALNSLKSLRTDLTTINPELLFSFQESVEPIHRQLINLLLQERNPSQSAMKEALSAIESLQVEELNHYLRAACLNAQVEPAAAVPESEASAVIYPVVLDNRLATIVRFPASQPDSAATKDAENAEMLEFYEADIRPDELKALVDDVIVKTNLGDYDVFASSQQLYNLLLPAQLRAHLQQNQTETLVFVLDSFLRNLSMATLYDGEHYLIEEYAVAIAPGLQLLNPEPPPSQPLSALTFGLTTPVDNFAALPSVRKEIDAIKKEMPIQSFFDGEFTRQQLKAALTQSAKPIVHLATHGKFNSNVEETFILAADERIYISELSEWIRAGNNSANPIELLVFSACETGISDDEGRAALGLAGIAVRSGAKSTVASLWQADDSATAVVMEEFYKQLASGTVNKANALQNAQKYFLANFVTEDNPYYWGGFILVGSWL